MKSNLLEAAAEILSKSKSSAPAEPMHKSDADVEDLGGDTPTVHQASNPDATTGKKATAPGAAPRVGAMPPAKLKEEKDDEDEDEDEMEDDEDEKMKNEQIEEAVDHKKFMATYTRNENNNRHMENVLHLAKHYGTEDDVKAAQSHINAAKKAGHNIEHKENSALHAKLWNKMNETLPKNKSYGKWPSPIPRVKIKEDVDAMFEDETISEDFKSKVSTIFEARVHDRVSQIQEELEAQYTQSLEEAIADVTVSITERVNDYLNYVVEEWMQENAIAIEKGLRTELTEEFIVGLRNLFVENYIDIPDEKVDLVEELSTKVEDLESKLNEQIDISIELVKELNESKKIEAFHTVTEGLTQTQIEKLKTLVESVEFTTEEEFVEKLETIKENYFPSDVKRADESSLHESVEDPDTANSVKISDPRMAVYAQAISRTLAK